MKKVEKSIEDLVKITGLGPNLTKAMLEYPFLRPLIYWHKAGRSGLSIVAISGITRQSINEVKMDMVRFRKSPEGGCLTLFNCCTTKLPVYDVSLSWMNNDFSPIVGKNDDYGARTNEAKLIKALPAKLTDAFCRKYSPFYKPNPRGVWCTNCKEYHKVEREEDGTFCPIDPDTWEAMKLYTRKFPCSLNIYTS